MKLCITATGKDLSARVDPRFGRAPYFLLVDTETLHCEAVANPASATGQGAGIKAAQLLTDRGVAALLTGTVGPNAVEALQAAGIKTYEGVDPGDTAQEAIDRFKQGKFSASSAVSPRGGCGQGLGLGRKDGQGRGWGRCRP
ncbi:MAG: NifB/NifX family molybdenum-iron cluster-binding protein [Desulfobulbia bacterium]